MHLGHLFGNVPSHKHCLQVDPKVLNCHPAFDDISGVGEVLDPLLNLGFKWSVVPGKRDEMAFDHNISSTLAKLLHHTHNRCDSKYFIPALKLQT